MKFSKRPFLLQAGAAGVGALAMASGGSVAARVLGGGPGQAAHGGHGLEASPAYGDSVYIEAFPTSPLILHPFTEAIEPLKALRPVAKSPEAASATGWKTFGPVKPTRDKQDADGATHSVWPSDLGLPDPLVYQIRLQVATYPFTKSPVLPIDRNGNPSASYDDKGKVYPAGTVRTLPESTIYGFNGTFVGVRINAEYGRPALVRFENHLGEDENLKHYARGDYGSPEYGFLTHLHNAHTASESDGNPYYRHAQRGKGGYMPGQWVDNLYLNQPAGDDDREKQSFFWFHDHFHNHTGADVYKGLVGIYPIYDPVLDSGDETKGLRLPGVRTDHGDGSFDVDYDVPLVFYDCRLDDGVTPHKDLHNGHGETHPEWWGKTFFRHFPDHGFVGDLFTVNGHAYPVLQVKRRKYRLRFLDASVSRIYEFKLMQDPDDRKGLQPLPAAREMGYGGDELQGQYRFPAGQPCMQFTQIATDGGLLPSPIVRDSFELWPAKRREFVVDFTRYQDGRPTQKGDVLYLVNVMKMTTGRMWNASSRFSPDPNYKVPVLKIVIGDDAEDHSVMPTPGMKLRDLWTLPPNWQDLVKNRRVFDLQRGTSSTSPEIEWLINGLPFDPTVPLAQPKQGSWEAWEIKNGGGGWVHPMHIHEEEHLVVMRNGKLLSVGADGTPTAPPDPTGHPDDLSREDVVALDPGESVVFLRRFRTFAGLTKTGTSFLTGRPVARYVAHCHNLAHEVHAMMFGWEIVPNQ